MTSSLVGSEMCIRDRFDKWGGEWRCLCCDKTPHGEDPLKEHVTGKEPVSYTHLTLPTICSV
eukprot:1945308-Prorocentrum_lima.AAC.1